MSFPFQSANLAGGEWVQPSTWDGGLMVPITPAPLASPGTPWTPILALPPYGTGTDTALQDPDGTFYWGGLTLPADAGLIVLHGHGIKKWKAKMTPLFSFGGGWDFTGAIAPFEFEFGDASDDADPPPNRLYNPGGAYQLLGGTTFSAPGTLIYPNGDTRDNVRFKFTYSVVVGRFIYSLPGNRVFADQNVLINHQLQTFYPGGEDQTLDPPRWRDMTQDEVEGDWPSVSVNGGVSSHWRSAPGSTRTNPAGSAALTRSLADPPYCQTGLNEGFVNGMFTQVWDVKFYHYLLHPHTRPDLG